ncbi:peptide-N4-(N-acetyl-beta-glucosaminyl)asparagine amidase A [Typha latifolia]|uniref:peptide-N4-(N-acetyl-beta- glucosaminyl)asparagine amidase A n=1 Tax=Typha latifolia TaxID=4733 RepID=UPI003C2EDB24
MASPPLPLPLLTVLLLLLPLHSAASRLPKLKLFTSELNSPSPHSPSPPPTTFFEVTRPIPLPETPPCSTLLLSHSFAFTYTKPPVTTQYVPPRCLQRHLNGGGSVSNVVLEWSATSRGRQFDRIFGVWLGGVELLRSCTAEPRPNGIFWSVKKDVGKYLSLFSSPSTLAVYLGNVVDSTYTGIYHVNISLNFYFGHGPDRGFGSPADLVLPISRDLPLNDGLWFLIQNSTEIQSKKLALPRNSYRAVLEVYVSFHQSDEFWYTNPPNTYLSENNITDVPGNGPFREVIVKLDGDVVAAVWPFTVIYTGGVNPLLWRPISGIGSFNLPSYDIEITPFLGRILDGKLHEFGFGVTNALDVWFVDANLHLWLDSKSSYTVGELIKFEAPDFVTTLVSRFQGLDGQFQTSATRHILSTGWVKSSYGKITTHSFQRLEYDNLMVFAGNGSIQAINQTINYNYGTFAKNPSSVLYSEEVFQSFPLHLYTGTSDQVNDSYSLIANVSLGFNEKKFSGERFGFSFSSLRNLQNGQGNMKVKGNLVTSGLGSTQQVYTYESTDGCYFRNVSSSNYTILYDDSEKSCTKLSPFASGKLFHQMDSFPSQDTFVGV